MRLVVMIFLFLSAASVSYASCFAALSWPHGNESTSLNYNASGYTQLACGPVSGEKTAVIIVMGQSLTANTVPTAYTPTSVKNQQLNIYDSKCYQARSTALGIGGSGQSWAYGRLADKLIARGTFKRVIMVPMGIGGTYISEWINTTNRPWLGRRIGNVACMLADAGLTATYVVWGQGESEAVSGTSQAAYFASLNTLIGLIRSAGINGKILINLQSRSNNAVSANVRNAQIQATEIAGVMRGADVDSLNNTYRYDGTHLNANGADALTTMLADIIARDQGETPSEPAPTPAPIPTPTDAPTPALASTLFEPRGKLGSSSGTNTGLSFRQVLTPSPHDFSSIRVTLRSGNTAGIVCDHVSVGKSLSGGAIGPSADTIEVPVEFKFKGSPGFRDIPSGGTVTSDWLNYRVSQGDVLVIICDTSMTKPSGQAVGLNQLNGVDVWWGSGRSYDKSKPFSFIRLRNMVWAIEKVQGQ